ncbi:hypothetical protein BCR39DRAFT_546542 [Naematelia encephala]|uniref:RRM domain-containing protein n=1 Tax=Naematelia encephala TaxID=71784 RepID=A0A1Y2AQ18_9TREE|nr:hypothetical protein BCR39DRAFT_546542 [Naematelia encephala]
MSASVVAQTLDPSEPSLPDPQQPDASTSASSRPGVTLSTEEEESAAENGLVKTEDGANGHDQSMNGHATEEANGKTDGEEQVEGGEKACETLYLQNLNEKVQIDVMKKTLASLFKPYRPLLPIVAHRNVRMRGQAFVGFADKESAARAKKDVHDFPLYGKAIQISFARSRSDAVVEKLEGEEGLEAHKVQRLEHKKRTRRSNPLRQKEQQRMKADETGAPSAKRQRIQMPDEYLPPNSVLFIQNLPEGTTSDDLREVFELHAGLVEIRTIPAKKDIAFVEYADEAAATIAKEALHNFKIDGETKMKVTYARK